MYKTIYVFFCFIIITFIWMAKELTTTTILQGEGIDKNRIKFILYSTNLTTLFEMIILYLNVWTKCECFKRCPNQRKA